MQNALFVPRAHSAKLSTFIKLPFIFKTFVLRIFEWPLKTDIQCCSVSMQKRKQASCYPLKLSTWYNRHAGCNWFIVWPMRWPVTFRIMCWV